MASAPIGEIPVLITGDWSDLQSAINDAVSAAESGAQDIASAFSNVQGGSGIADSVTAATQALEDFGSQAAARESEFGTLGDYLASLDDDFNNLPGSAATAGSALGGLGDDAAEAQTALDGVGSAIGSLGTEADTAGPQVENLATPLANVHEDAGEAESALGEMGEKLFELGEALTVAEVLKEFAGDALETYANVQKASISLTALTGSAGAAKEMIEGLKTLALDNALEFEPLVGAAQKMTALGLSADQTNTALHTAADTAAATGGSFDEVANAIERMALSGTAGARQLATLGISTNALGQAMGVAAADVTTAFKALDQEQRLTDLETALAKFSGVAGQVAGGISGQWQTLKTQWEFILEDMGAAMAPLASEIVGFLSGTVLPAVQAVVDGFQSLSPTLQEVVIVAGIAIPAIYAVGAALDGLSAVFPALGAGVAMLGPVAGVIALVGAALVGMHIEGFDTAVMNLYHAFADNFPNIPGFLGPIGTAFDALIGKSNSWFQDILTQKPLVALGFEDLQTKLAAISPSTANKSISAWLQTIISPSKMVTLLLNQLAEGVQYIGTSYQSMAPEVKLQLDILNTANDQFNHSLAESAGAFTSLSAPVSQIAKDYQTLKDNLAAAQTNLKNVTTAFNEGEASAGQLAAAVKAVDTAQTALNPSWITAKQAATDLNTATKDLNASQGTLDGLLKAISPSTVTLTQAQNNLKTAQAEASQAAANLAIAQQNLNGAIAAGPAGANALKAAETALKTAEQEGTQAGTDLKTAQNDLTAARKEADTQTKEQQTTDSDYAKMLTSLANPAIQEYSQGISGVGQAADKLHTAMMNELTAQADVDAAYQEGGKDSSDYKTAVLALNEAHKQVLASDQALTAAEKDATTVKTALTAGAKALQSAEQLLSTLYEQNSIPDVKDFTGQLDALRLQKQQVANDTNTLVDAEDAYQDAIDGLLSGTYTVPEYKQAVADLDTAKTKLTNDNKLLNTTETNLNQTFGLSKAVLKDITNDQGNMDTATQNANAAFTALGLNAPAQLQTVADKATTAYNTILQSGSSSWIGITNAEIAALKAQQAALIAAGSNLSTAQQNTLNVLTAQQTAYMQSTVSQWAGFASNVSGQISQLSNTLVTNLFTGKDSFGKTAITALENIASAFVSDMIKPIVNAIANFIATSLLQLGQAITGIGSDFTSMSSTAVSALTNIGKSASGLSSSGGGSLLASLFGIGGGGVQGAPADALSGVNALGGTDLAAAGQGIADSAADAGSTMASAAGAVATSVTGAISAIGGVVGAITGIIGDIETGRSNDILYSIEQNTTATAILMGQQVQLMWRLAADLEYGEIEKGMNIISADIDGPGKFFWQWGIKDLDAISSFLSQILGVLQKSNSASGGVAAGNVEYIPGSAAVPGTPYQAQIPVSGDIDQALNNYQKTLQGYIDGQDTATQVELAQQQVNLTQNMLNKQEEYTEALEKYLANPNSPALSEALAFATAQYQASQYTTETETTAGTPAGPPTEVTTVGELVTANTALDNINNTLQYNVGLNPWWQTAIQNVNNSIVTCAGWLQGISGLLQSGINTAGSTVNASSAGLSALASYIGANFTSFETWMFNALGRTMALPALPSPIAIPSALAGASGTGSGVTLNVNTTVQGSVVGQNGMNQLTTTIANNMVAKLRNSGLKY